MADIGGSVEDYLAKKMKLNELTRKEQIQKVFNHFKSVIDGEIKTTPPEFGGLLQLMIDLLADDEQAVFVKYMLRHDEDIKDFFVRNFQRFNYYDFKHKLMILRGESPKQEFQVPVNSDLNYERIEPLNITPYAELLESNPLEIKVKKEKTERLDAASLVAHKKNVSNIFDEKIKEFKNALQKSINQGMISKEHAEKKLSEIEERCISTIQMRYNSRAISELRQVILGEDEIRSSPSKIFDELKMSMVSRELFYRLLVKQIK